ncbi:hypothetical protein [Chitinimonas sp. BJB300]|uniref:hypothetical protein n=1 Tax=Chitinimonas sp. BJB300 TaxID=1559339 RepID=UPI000C0F57D7|nr:hypothetical protein [Chitinimonas sp. BJB300]PHV13160.1 hypothetical protein CSQ89_01820 [Chitinimonas sp. BJB300]TSJ87141.1 hypothetical protein FG002_015320 [Chitinimonas sp. BJB300]
MTQPERKDTAWGDLLGPACRLTQDGVAALPADLAGLLDQLHRDAAPLRAQSIAKLKAGEVQLPPAALRWWLAKLEETQLQNLLRQEALQFDPPPVLDQQMKQLLNRLDQAMPNTPAASVHPGEKAGFWARLTGLLQGYDKLMLASFALAAAALSVLLEVQNSDQPGLDETWATPPAALPPPNHVQADMHTGDSATVVTSSEIAIPVLSTPPLSAAADAPVATAKATPRQKSAARMALPAPAATVDAVREEASPAAALAMPPQPASAPMYNKADRQVESIPQPKLMRAPVSLPVPLDTLAEEIEHLMSQGEVGQAHGRWCDLRQQLPGLDQQIRPTYRQQLLQLGCPPVPNQ